MIELYFTLIPFVVLILLGLTVGRVIERNHLKRLTLGKQQLGHILLTDLRTMPGADERFTPILVVGEATISANFLRTWLASLKKIVGGELRMYETLMARAREEATLRMLAEAQRLGADAVANLRLETADISGARQGNNKQAAMATIMVYGTAYRRLNG